ncbi:protein PIMREG [Rana temporaria]|uniref:protein PIMREG n=1 Tax=Rana temporaria TaxID=8407 RepID=UPI001AAD6553|nr:protein PIMREG [Rana temporaria]
MSSILQNVGWRSRNVLENIDEQDSPRPDKFRKMPSSSSLNSLRMSLRKRMPLKPVEMNINAVPDWDRVGIKEKQRPLKSMTVTAKNVFGSVSQKIKKSGQKSSNYLIASPKQLKVSKREIRTPGSNKKSLTPRTPRCRRLVEEASPNMRVTPKSTRRISPRSRRSSSSQWRNFTNLIGNEGLHLRRSVRAASLKSPYASPATLNRRKFDKDLETVSAGIRQLKRLSRVFDDAIFKEERKEAILNYHSLMAKNLHCAHRSRLSWRSTRRLQHTIEGWTEVALTSIGNIGAR